MKCKFLENQINIAPNGEYRLCCISSEERNTPNIYTHSPQAWHDTEFHRSVRATLNKDVWPDACAKCRVLEDKNLPSKRSLATPSTNGLTHFDLRLGNSCNLKCISCWHMSSNRIASEAIAMKSAGVEPLHEVVDVPHFNWATTTNLKKLEGYPIEEVYLTGGEPMMSKELPRLLDQLAPTTVIRFNTNCTLWNPTLEKQLKKFNTVIMSLSLDAVDRRIEYIRHGSVWKNIEENAKRYSDFCLVDISPTVSVLNASFLNDIREYADKRNWNVYENYLYTPAWLRCANAPELLKLKFQGLPKEWSNIIPSDIEIQKFRENIVKLDKWRGKHINDYLPEVANAYGLN